MQKVDDLTFIFSADIDGWNFRYGRHLFSADIYGWNLRYGRHLLPYGQIRIGKVDGMVRDSRDFTSGLLSSTNFCI
jgi:hypothetical protein